ncbi:MAG: dTDP-4-dehydrorhamnose reductase [Lachnospiraceae bacterium]|nr:dTDP-4-dehydrorhamnose reductase [bacterium]MDY5518178.1 dTDP-4-dehydrorhamnose reductase [Lachnospiraceae bacterium]
MKKIMVTGCNGQLGREIQKEYENDEVELLCTDVGDLDISDHAQIMEYVRQQKPDVIINCAAYTAVDACENAWDLAYRINAIGPRNLAIAAREVGAKLVHISTDYVFEGNASVPYTEFDEVHPVSAYGKTKLEGERFVQQFADRYFILRTAWLYGDGNNFAKTMLRLSENHEKVRVVCDQFGSPTSAAELAKVIHVLEPTANYGLFHATCEGSCSWADFAEEVFRLAGKSTKVERVTTEEYASPTKRPAYSVLDNYMLRLTTDYRMADWKDALLEYLR